ncbi:hypothetical protein [Streptomyces sp. NPDC012616]|uniref:hypothetical protein n=1 Tax=Streptomyces sp. NPDC012616 TaxID=3364840 RepID=UPI0036E75C10
MADAADLGAVDTLTETVRNRRGRLDSLFTNAGTGTFPPFENTDQVSLKKRVSWVYQLMFFVAYCAVQHVIDHNVML